MNSRKSSARPGSALNPPATVCVPQLMQTINVRLSGDLPGIEAVLGVLRAGAGDAGCEIGLPSVPYPNRREPGHRVYVTLRLPAGETTSSDAGRRTAAKLSAAPLPSRQGGTPQ